MKTISNNNINKRQSFLIRLFNDIKANYVKLLLISVIVVFFVIYIAFSTGVWQKEPTVDIKANNGYTETVRVVTDMDYRPYSYIDSNSKAAGYDVELITSIANTMEKNLNLELMSWSDALDAIQNDKADVLMTCDTSDIFNYEPSPVKTTVTSIDDYVLFSKKKVKSFDELLSGNNRIGYMSNGNAEDVLAEMELLDNCIGFSTNKDILLAIESGELDAGIMRHSIGRMILKDLNLNSIKGQFSIKHSYMCFVVNPNHPELVEQINSAFNELRASGQVAKLDSKWLTTFVEPKSVWEVLHEQNWLVMLILFFVVVVLILQITANQKEHSLLIIESLTKNYEIVFNFKFKKNKDIGLFSVYKDTGFIPFAMPKSGKLSLFTECLNQFVNEVVVPEDRQYVASMVEQERVISFISQGKEYPVFFRGIIEGKIYYLRLTFISNKNANGKVNNCVIGLKNVDEDTKKLLHQAEELKKARKSVEDALTAKTTFLSNMSHDIRTPMNAILGYIAVAKKHMDDAQKVTDCLGKIEIAGNTLVELINQILEMSRIESGHCELFEGEFDIAKKSVEITSIFDSISVSKNITLKTDFSGIRHNTVYSDAIRITQIVSNVLSNAFKYTPNNGTVTFTVNEEPCDKQNISNYIISVKDTGIGMSAEFLEHIFENFSREKNSTVSGIQGTGLGMSIVNRLIDLFGGTISIHSEQGKGTEMVISLPLKYLEEDSSSVETNDEKVPSSLCGFKILLVDDNEMNREIGAELLEESGAQVKTADDGSSALETIQNSAPGDFDLILMDIQMPIMNGYDATKAIRALDNTALSSIPIIAMTANAFKEDRDMALSSGMNAHIAKPIDIETVTKTINSIVRK